ncbi:zinc finger protein [Trichoderma arundinaceum]|uniref:Zinc finger protein n=1 Tax=Trichoderma arundinaceum TaxID=490622 RepID=A0A395NLI4_TRIAR|nr:zinc finger protein [Trichoderma arundinaceum]
MLLTDHWFALTDPSLIHPEISRPPMAISSYETHYQPAAAQYPTSPSALSASSPQPHMIRTSSSSPYLQSGSFQPATAYTTSPYAASTAMAPGAGIGARRLSMSKTNSNNGNSFISPVSADYHSGDEVKEKQRCSYPDCGKTFKDLKAHMLTHQTERPEKCPIMTCEYHVKGFARKYDKNRHTLTHYKGTMVCGFCPGSGSAAEKSFNRADVFKRHLTAVHGVEQTPPNSRRRSGVVAPKTLAGYAPDATGKCSTCSQTFTNAQDFYEHLDDCVLRIVQQEDPAEAINAQRLAEVADDKNVHQTLEKNNLPVTTQTSQTEEDEEDEDMGDEDEVDDISRLTYSPLKKKTSLNRISKSRGITHSRGGVQLSTKSRGRNKRRDYPSSWGFNKGQMTMKKRVVAVFDGPRRLAKDDMMLSTDHEVRIKLSDGKSYVTDLDVQTLKRAEGFHNASDEEKGPWISDDPTEEQMKEMQRMLDTGASDM